MNKKKTPYNLSLVLGRFFLDTVRSNMYQIKWLSVFKNALFLLVLMLLFFSFNLAKAQNPIAYYKFDDNATDNSGNNNHGAIRGLVKPTTDRFGNPCGAMLFDGQSGFIEVPSSPSLESPSFALTIALWYKLSDVPGAAKWLTAVCKGLGNSELQNPQYRLQVQQTPGLVSTICRNGIGSSTISINTAFTKCDDNYFQHSFEVSNWCFYAITYDGTKVSAYMNDTKVFEQAYYGNFVSNNSPLHIGLDEPGLTEYFAGSLDDLRIYAAALTENEIMNLYNDQRGTSTEQEAFTFESPDNIRAYVPTSGCSVAVNFKEPVASSLCGRVTVAQTSGQVSGSLFDCGRHLISYTAKSSLGYEQSCSFYIYVYDTIRPFLEMPADTVIYVKKGEAGTMYVYARPVASDNCGRVVCTLTAGSQSGELFRQGINKVTYTAKDIYGNATVKGFKVEVKEQPVDLPAAIDSAVIVKTRPGDLPERVHTEPPGKRVEPIAENVLHDGKDTIILAAFLKDKTQKLVERKTLKTDEIEVESALLRVELYDNAEIDNDTVSLFLNKQPVVLDQRISDKPISFSISIDTLSDNELSLFAENLGSIPPNTALMILYDGQKRYEIRLASTFSSNGTVIIRRRKKQ
jgi:Concanavalin A-like lectin/glucanases superfamily/HYR domain